MSKFTYDANAVKNEARIWILKPEDIDWVVDNLCTPNGVLSLNIPIGDHFCREFTRQYKSSKRDASTGENNKPERNPYKAKNLKPATFDMLPIVLPRILNMKIPELGTDAFGNKRFSEKHYRNVLGDKYTPYLSKHAQNDAYNAPNKPELTRIRNVLLLLLSEKDYHWIKNELLRFLETENCSEADAVYSRQETFLLTDHLRAVIPKVLIDGIMPGAQRDEEFEYERLQFWKIMKQGLGILHADSIAEKIHIDPAGFAERIEKSVSIPSYHPAGGYYRNLYEVIETDRIQKISLEDPGDEKDPTSALQNQIADKRSIPHDVEVVAADAVATFETFIPFLTEFFSTDLDPDYRGNQADVDPNYSNTEKKAAQRNAWQRAPQNVLILLKRYWRNPDLTTFNFQTGTPTDLISDAKDFNKLKNRATRFLELKVEDQPRRSKDLLELNVKESDEPYGKSIAIFAILSMALNKQNDEPITDPEKTKKMTENEKKRQDNRERANAKKWQLRDFQTLLHIWLESRVQNTHDRLYELCELEKDKEFKHPLLKIFEPIEKVRRVRLKKANTEELEDFFTLIFEASDRHDELAAAIRTALDLPEDAPIRVQDLEHLTLLTAQDCGIYDLTGLQHATNLQALELDGNRISDISALAKLTNLTKLSLRGNTIEDISALAKLTNLKVLYLSDNPIKDTSAIYPLTLDKLTKLDIEVSKVRR